MQPAIGRLGIFNPAPEYALLVIGMSIAIAGVVWLVGGQLFNLFDQVEDKLANRPKPDASPKEAGYQTTSNQERGW
jgi:Flp pilus assembly pilin Flp